MKGLVTTTTTTMIIITVTQEDIKNGERHDSHKCPVALACLRTINMTWFDLHNKLQTIPDADIFPGKVGIFMPLFDAGQVVEPFSFEIPNEIVK